MPFSIHKMPFYSVSPTINMDVKKNLPSLHLHCQYFLTTPRGDDSCSHFVHFNCMFCPEL